MKYKIISALIIIILVTNCSEDAPAEPDILVESDSVSVPVPVTVSGSIGDESTHTSHVGLFSIYGGLTLPIRSDDTYPLVVAPINGNQWTLDISDINEDGFYLLFGWSDLDGDERYDPLSGENPAFLHVNQDTLSEIVFYYPTRNEWLLRFSEPFKFGPLTDYLDSFFLYDDSQADPLTSWIALDSTFSFLSGFATVSNVQPFTMGIHFKGMGAIDSDGNASISNISLRFPDIITRVYAGSEFSASVRSSVRGSFSGNIGRAGLTFVDTVDQKRVRGWVALNGVDGFYEGAIEARVYGTFDVPIQP